MMPNLPPEDRLPAEASTAPHAQPANMTPNKRIPQHKQRAKGLKGFFRKVAPFLFVAHSTIPAKVYSPTDYVVHKVEPKSAPSAHHKKRGHHRAVRLPATMISAEKRVKDKDTVVSGASADIQSAPEDTSLDDIFGQIADGEPIETETETEAVAPDAIHEEAINQPQETETEESEPVSGESPVADASSQIAPAPKRTWSLFKGGLFKHKEKKSAAAPVESMPVAAEVSVPVASVTPVTKAPRKRWSLFGSRAKKSAPAEVPVANPEPKKGEMLDSLLTGTAEKPAEASPIALPVTEKDEVPESNLKGGFIVQPEALTTKPVTEAELPPEDDSFLSKVKNPINLPVASPAKKGWFKVHFFKGAAKAPTVKEEIVPEEDSFLGKVKLQTPVSTEEKKKSNGWSLIKTRFFSRTPKSAIKEVAASISPEEVASDSFLQRTQKKNPVDAIAAVQEEPAQEQPAGSTLDSFANGNAPVAAQPEAPKGRILFGKNTAAEAKKIDEEYRLAHEAKDIKQEMLQEQQEREKRTKEMAEIDKKLQKKEPEAAPNQGKLKHREQFKKKNGFQQMLSSIGYIGLGKERMRFVENMATMLNAGLPLIDSLKTLQVETRAKPMKKVLQKILEAVENGSPLWRAMDDQSFFSPQAMALIRIGEEAGNLAQNMEYLAAQEEKDHALKSKVKMAMIYPTIVMTIMFVIVIGLGMFVLPNLIGVLYSLNVKLPLTTQLVIMFSNFFSNHGVVAVPGCIGFFFLCVILAKFTPARVFFQWLMFHVPGIGRLAREATIARFGVILGGLLRAGVPVIDAMQSLVQVTPIVSYRKLYARMLDHITVGDSFSKSFASIKGSQHLLPPSVQQLVITGEKSGALSDIMLKIADIYDKKATETAQKLPVILEPMLLIFIGGLVGTIAFAIIVPIYSIVGNVGR